MVFTIFIFALIVFFNFFRIMETQLNLQVAASQAAAEVASYGYSLRYLEDYIGNYDNLSEILPISLNDAGLLETVVKKEAGSLVLKQMVKSRLSTYELENLWIKNGFEGISFEDSLIYDDECVTIKMSYRFRIIPFEFTEGIETVQTVRVRCFSGYYVQKKEEDAETEDEDFVYITATGEAYHLSADCRSLKVTVETHNYSELDMLRNLNGGKYTSCKTCSEGTEPNAAATIYVTPYGSSYHINVSCGSLKRTIQKVHVNETGNRRECKMCGILLE